MDQEKLEYIPNDENKKTFEPEYKKREETLFLEFDVNGTVMNLDSSNVDSSLGLDQKVQQFRNLILAKYLKGEIEKVGERQIFVPSIGGSVTYKSFLSRYYDKKQRHDLSQSVLKDFSESLQLQHMNRVLCSQKSLLVPSFIELIRKLEEMNQSFIVMFRTFGNDLNLLKQELKKEFPKILQINPISLTSKQFFDLKKDSAHKQCKEFMFFQDDYKRWHEGGEKAEFGKDFAAFPNSYFFDDNDDIVNPVDEQGKHLDLKDLPPFCKVILVNNFITVSYRHYFLDHIFCE